MTVRGEPHCDGSALLRQKGHHYDLNTLVGPTDVFLTTATYANDHGSIVAIGTLPSGHRHVFLLPGDPPDRGPGHHPVGEPQSDR